jgi:hypothetical protein
MPGKEVLVDNSERQKIAKKLSKTFQVQINRVLKFTGDTPKYRLETGAGAVTLGDVRGLIGQSRLRNSIAACTGIYMPLIERDDWPTYASMLLRICEDVDRGPDATKEGALAEFLAGYLDQHQPHRSLEEADEGREPFIKDDEVYIYLSPFKRWLAAQVDERVGRDELTADLRAFGAEPKKIDTEINGKPTSRSAWRLPEKAYASLLKAASSTRP